MVKLLIGWNIIPGKESEYFDFVVKEFQPGLEELGLQTTEVWYTAYGNLPQIVTGAIAPNLETLQGMLNSEKWQQMKEELQQYITDYRQKIIPATGGYQL